MKWIQVLRSREKQRWHLVHPSGAVLAEMLLETLSNNVETLWVVQWRRVFGSATELGFETRDRIPVQHARDAREARAEILVGLRNVDRLPKQSLTVEPIKRESRRRAAKRAAFVEELNARGGVIVFDETAGMSMELVEISQ